MTRGQQLSRLLKLEAQHGTTGSCSACGMPTDEAPVPGRLSVAEIEARALVLLGGERFARWPRCGSCRRLLPLDQARREGVAA